MLFDQKNSNKGYREEGFFCEWQTDASTGKTKFFAEAYDIEIIQEPGNRFYEQETILYIDGVEKQKPQENVYQQQLIGRERQFFSELSFLSEGYVSETDETEKSENNFGKNWHDWRRHPWHELKQAASGIADTLIADAHHNLGQPVWAATKFAALCESGNLGCAATVSELLQESGVRIPGSAGVYGLVDQLSAAGWQKIKISDKHQFRPGDVVFGVRGSHGHIGIISQVNNNQVLVCDNSSSTGTLKERTIESGGSFTPGGRFAGSLYVMRPGQQA